MKYLDISIMLAVTLAGLSYAATNGAGGGTIFGMFVLGFITIALTLGHKTHRP